ncbi:MAG: SOS response-associated peptidase [Micromonosporaceae bacterium]|nr:SOS response-associated peptidase [Micromonosporaceae bacterium]
MCGRYASTRSSADLAALFEVEDMTDGELVPSYNVAPTDPAPIVRVSAQRGPVLCVARWGFLPPWSRSPRDAARMINARAETVAGSRVYGEAFARRRCLVPADGWYEWRITSDTTERSGRAGRPVKQPYFMTRPDAVVFGGVWSVWGTGADARLTFSIITVPAVGDLAAVHDRMPLLIEPHRWVDWLRGSDMAGLLTPPSSNFCADIEIRPVSAAVGDVRKDGPELVHPHTVTDPDLSTVEFAPTLF